ncbi:MAG: SGNH/GDSL hydrolase family protein [Deltaproteobacteria bacterium]|nr:MAG: SGNH/GDSL hydrolase family protein [Deltaproteobacteria bacterium]
MPVCSVWLNDRSRARCTRMPCDLSRPPRVIDEGCRDSFFENGELRLSSRRTSRMLLVLFSTALAVAAAELCLRLVWTPPSLRSTIAFGPHEYYRVAPLPCISGRLASAEYEHSFHHTCQRFRGDRIFTRVRPEGIRARVLLLGDSFAYGLGVGDAETFAARLERALPGVEIANTGCNGYGTRDELAVLDLFGEAFRPDLTILFFFWNDLENNLKRTEPSFSLSENGRVQRTDETVAPDFDPMSLWRPAANERRTSGAPYLALLFKEGLKGFRYRVLGISTRFIRTPEQKEDAWRITRDLLRLVARRTAEIGSRLLLVSIPSQSRVDPSAVIKHIEPLHYVVEERLSAVCRELGIEYLDTRPALVAAFGRGAHLYYYADRHLTAEGHRVVAETVLPRVQAFLGAGSSSNDFRVRAISNSTGPGMSGENGLRLHNPG